MLKWHTWTGTRVKDMRELASADIYVTSKELQRLVGSHIKKFYDIGDGAFRFSLTAKEGKDMLYVKLLRTINVTAFTEAAEGASNFAMAMRKRVGGAKVTAIAQHGTDRVIIISLSGENEFRIVLEMYGKGNLIVIDKDNIISLVYKIMDQRERKIRPRERYTFQGGDVGFDAFNTEIIEDRIREARSEKGTKLIKALISKLDFGPIYTEDIITRAGLDPNSTTSISNDEAKKLTKEAEEFLNRLKFPTPLIYLDDKGIETDYAVTELKKYDALKKEQYGSFGETLDTFYKKDREKTVEIDNKALREAATSVEKQKALILKMREEEVESKLAGTKIFNRMHEINQLIAYLKESKKATLEEVKQAFPNLDIEAIDLRKKEVILNVD